jgi:hypothetical protein
MKLIEPQSWSEAAKMLATAFPYFSLEEAPKACLWQVIRNAESDPSADLRRAEEPFLQSIEAVIRRFDIDKRLVSPSLEIAYFIGLRAHVASLFLATLSTHGPNDSESIVAYPTNKPFLKIIEWLLLDWWRENGYDAACKFQLFDECFE